MQKYESDSQNKQCLKWPLQFPKQITIETSDIYKLNGLSTISSIVSPVVINMIVGDKCKWGMVKRITVWLLSK